MIPQYLCALSDIPDGCSKGATCATACGKRELILVRRSEKIFVYVNSCPHTGATLNWQPDEFMSFDGFYIQCSIHGAQFRVYDGYCVYGPCAGQSLRRVAAEINNGDVFIALED